MCQPLLYCRSADTISSVVAYLTNSWRKALASYAEHSVAMEELMKSIGENESLRSRVDGWIAQMQTAEEQRIYPGTSTDPSSRHPTYLDFYNIRAHRGKYLLHLDGIETDLSGFGQVKAVPRS